VETQTSTGNDVNPGKNLYVAVTDESRVLRIQLSGEHGSSGDDDEENNERGTVFVSDYVRPGVNAPADFTNPDNLALDKAGNLFITEDTTAPPGMDIWMATPSRGRSPMARRVVRFASLTDCTAEPSGIYFNLTGKVLFVNVLHRAGQDLGVAITRARRRDD
jgi:secreted PhoX family phosphatase